MLRSRKEQKGENGVEMIEAVPRLEIWRIRTGAMIPERKTRLSAGIDMVPSEDVDLKVGE